MVQKQKMSAKLRVISATVQRTFGYILIQGRVANGCEQELNNVVAVAEYWSNGGILLKKSDMLVDMTSMKPQHASTFSIITEESPEIDYVQLSFKYLLGDTIETSGCTTLDKNGLPRTLASRPVQQFTKPNSLLKRLKTYWAEIWTGHSDRRSR